MPSFSHSKNLPTSIQTVQGVLLMKVLEPMCVIGVEIRLLPTIILPLTAVLNGDEAFNIRI